MNVKMLILGSLAVFCCVLVEAGRMQRAVIGLGRGWARNRLWSGLEVIRSSMAVMRCLALFMIVLLIVYWEYKD